MVKEMGAETALAPEKAAMEVETEREMEQEEVKAAAMVTAAAGIRAAT